MKNMYDKLTPRIILVSMLTFSCTILAGIPALQLLKVLPPDGPEYTIAGSLAAIATAALIYLIFIPIILWVTKGTE